MGFPSKLITLLLASACCAPVALAQNFPTKPLKIIGSNPGGAGEVIARFVAQALTLSFGQPVVFISRPGSMVSPAMEVARAEPDGHTLMSLGGNQFWLLPLLQNVPYDPVRDFAPVTLAATSPNVVVVNSLVPAHSIRELIALAKSRPGALNYGIGNFGGGPHLAGELFKMRTQTDIMTVPFKSTALALNGVVAGQVQLLFPTMGSAVPLIKAGKVRALAVTSEKASALAPDLPTVNESGIPGYESSTAFVVFAPAKTPVGVIGALNRAIVKYLQTADVREKVFAAGLEIVASSPQELGDVMKLDRERTGKVIRDVGIKSED